METDKQKSIVLHKDGVWYAKGLRYSWKWGEARINGREVTVCPDPEWCSTDEEPKLLERFVTPSSKLVGYKKKDEFADINVPLEQTVEFFAYDFETDTRKNQELYGFYREVREIQAGYWEVVPCDFIIANMDTAPQSPKYQGVVAQPPAYFAQYPEVHHLFPCAIEAKALYPIVAAKIRAAVEGKPQFSVDAHDTIQTMRVNLNVELPTPINRKEKKLFGRGYIKWKQAHSTVKIIDIDWYRGGPRLTGANYNDIEKVIDQFIANVTQKLDAGRMVVCSHCQGYGVTSKEGHDGN